jgi:dolichol kinase
VWYNKEVTPVSRPAALARKALHVVVGAGLFVTACISLTILGKQATLFVGATVLLVEMIFEFVRVEWGGFSFVRHIVKQHEEYNFSALTSGLAVGLVVLAVFDEPIALAAVGIGVLGDVAAAVVGILWGRHRYALNPDKTWEGFTAHAVVGSLIGLLFVPPAVALSMAGVAALVELNSSKIDDNFFVPLVAAFAGWLVSFG